MDRELAAEQVKRDQQKRKSEALEVFKKYPDAVPLHLQKKVIAQQVNIGMDPHMARLAGGACSFDIVADPAVWPLNADPFNVMDAQSLRPDASKISLIFSNTTQYPNEGNVHFRAVFVQGRVAIVEKV